MSLLRAILAALTALAPVAATAASLIPLRGGPFEASGAAAVPGGGGVLVVDDGRPSEVLWLPLAAEGSAGDVRVVPTGVAVADPEGITSDGRWIYVTGSLSRGKGAALARFRFDPASGTASGGESMDGLEPLIHAVMPEPAAGPGRGRKKDAGSALNVEGLAWDPRGRRLLLGVRSPVLGGHALVVPLTLRDPEAPLSAGNVQAGAPLRIDLGGSGIRGIEYDERRGAFLVVAGHPTGARDFRLVTWDGAGTGVREVQRFAGAEKPEGVAAATLGGSPATVVVFDTSHLMVLR